MRAALDDLVARRLADQAAIPAFTCYGADTALAVVSAAEEAGLPVILLVAPSAAEPRLIRTLRAIADAAAVPVCVQLDHAKDAALISMAIEHGVDAVLADGSHLPPDANAAFVREVGAFAAPRGVVVEAELGSVPGDEDRAEAVEVSGKTDPAQVRPFLAASGAQLLACGVGNVHGRYRGAPALDWPRLARVRAEAGTVPLVLHGASGLPPSDLRRCGAAGVGKVNVNTELRTAMLETLEAGVGPARASGEDMLALTRAVLDKATGVARTVLETLGG
ncbi:MULTISPECIES: class II fructose-bisphosphate aldolase [unclassified Amycolatopsis]|uniref:class II fructose-bisphosphate aldolase n=1 Tax=unclassified Amycolatopsis TaxID=2618356 RepID=UPI001C6A2900|nr:class II fructose-bisphosphate aldolase [Amycolatopsis sp. DSM 110486]QYN22616.1 class II fructose-bisphosphate aldolase [Amycolatopsis sp. DSM 110486]